MILAEIAAKCLVDSLNPVQFVDRFQLPRDGLMTRQGLTATCSPFCNLQSPLLINHFLSASRAPTNPRRSAIGTLFRSEKNLIHKRGGLNVFATVWSYQRV